MHPPFFGKIQYVKDRFFIYIYFYKTLYYFLLILNLTAMTKDATPSEGRFLLYYIAPFLFDFIEGLAGFDTLDDLVPKLTFGETPSLSFFK